MKFGPVSPKEAIGGVAVHAIRRSNFTLKKGTLIDEDCARGMLRAGVREIVVARLDENDVSEDVAADNIAKSIAGYGVFADEAFTGRANLFALRAGILLVDRAAVEAINGIDEAITFATLPPYKAVMGGEMIATVKLIPFGIHESLRDKAVAAALASRINVAPYTVKRVAMISTTLPGLASKVFDKTVSVTKERLAPAQASIIFESRVPHDRNSLKSALYDAASADVELVLVFGASAVADRRDVIPSAIEAVGGKIEHLGMPVDPGNLILLGSINGIPVIGAPGCARSPKENGFDWVLSRVLAGLKVTRQDIISMGAGGLLMEIVNRPQPRILPGPNAHIVVNFRR